MNILNLCLHISVTILAIIVSVGGQHNRTNAADIKCDQTFPSLCLITMVINLSPDEVLNIAPMDHAHLITRFEITSASSLKEFPKQIFESFPNVEAVTLNSADIQFLVCNSFKNASNLKDLHLKLNKLTIVQENAFKNANKLEQLDLSGNEIMNIEDFGFQGLRHLRTLKLNGNQLKVLRNQTFFDLENLEYLHLYSNQLRTIETHALTLPKLTEIFFGHNKLRILPNDLFLNAPSVEVAEFRDNQIIRIGDTFFDCHDIYSLNLENNPIEDIDLLKFAKMKSLSSLSLNNTKFTFASDPLEITESITKSSSLESLNLANNNLNDSNIFQHLIMFPELQRLYLYNNRFIGFDNAHEIKIILPKLNTLDLMGNDLMIDWLRHNNGIFKRNEINVLTPRYK